MLGGASATLWETPVQTSAVQRRSWDWKSQSFLQLKEHRDAFCKLSRVHGPRGTPVKAHSGSGGLEVAVLRVGCMREATGLRHPPPPPAPSAP